MMHIIASNDGIMIDGDRNYAFDDPRTMTALDFVYDILVNDGVWLHDPLNLHDWAFNFWAFQEGTSAFWPFTVWGTIQSDTNFNFAFVPFPTGPDNTSGATNSGGFRMGLAIPAGVTNPNDVFDMYEELKSWARDDVALVNEGMVEYVRSGFLHEDDVWRLLHDVNQTRVFDLGNVIHGYNWVLGSFADAFIMGQMTVAQAVETERQPRQELINDAFRE
jgi:ABC-type glycerol-3-phosphate transport system substrate-binding protein